MRPDGINMETDLNRTKSLAADLPEHILADSILSSYSVNEYYIYTQVCKHWSAALRSEWLWKRHCEARGFHPNDSSPTARNKRHAHGGTAVWRDIYRRRHSVEKRFSRGQYVERKRDSRSAPILDLKTFSTSALAACRTGRILVYDLNENDPSREGFTAVAKPRSDLIRPLETDAAFPTKAVAALACLPFSDGYAAGAYADGGLTIWRLDNQGAAASWVGHRGGAATSVCHMEGSKLASVGSDGYGRVWDTTAVDKCIWSSPPPTREGEEPSMRIKKQFTSVSRVDAHVVIAGRKDSSWRVYDTRLGSRVTEVGRCEMNDWCMCVEADGGQGSHMVRASDKAVKIFDLRRCGSPLQQRHQSPRLLTRFCSDGRYRLVSCGLDGRVLVSSLERDDSKRGPSEVHSEDDYMLACAFDSARLVVAGLRGKVNIFGFDGR